MKLRTLFFYCIFIVYIFPVYSQETKNVPNSIWETPEKLISYAKEQASIDNLGIIELIENDHRLNKFNVEDIVNFYEQTQLGFCKAQDWDNAKKYELRAIRFAKDNDSEDLCFSGAESPFINHDYYWVACYEAYKQNLDSAVYYSLLNLSEIKDFFGEQSKEFLCAILSPILFCKSRDLVESLDYGDPEEEYNDSIKPKLIVTDYDNYHDAIQTINSAINEYQYSDSLLLGELMWHKGDLLYHNGNIEDGLSFMYQSIALLSKSGLCLTNNFDGIYKLIYVTGLLGNTGDWLTAFIVNKFLLDEFSDKFDEESLYSVKANIVSTAIHLWLFDYADKYLAELEACGDDEYSIAQNKYYRGLYYSEYAKESGSIEPIYQAIPYYEDIIRTSWHKDRMTTHLQLMELYNVIGSNTGDFSKLEAIQERIIDLEEDKIIERLSNSTTNQEYNPLSGMNYDFSVVNEKTMGQFFEHILFRWSIVTEFSKAIEKLALKDKFLSQKWMLIKDYKDRNVESCKIDSLEHDLMRNIDPRELKKYLKTDISKIQKQLDNEEMLVVLTLDQADSIFAICLSKSNPPQKIVVSDKLSDDLLKQPSTEVATEIGNHICPYLKDYKNLYLLINNSFYNIPLEKYILSNYKDINVHRILSFRDFKAKEGNIKDIIAFGNPNLNQIGVVSKERGFFFAPLPGTAIEIDSISKILDHKSANVHVRSFVKNEASEENFKLLDNSKTNLIHFATHAFLGKQRVFDDSGLLLSGANIELNSDSTVSRFSNEGILRACEIENMHFSNLELVVLSACETGAGGSNIDYGVLGLPLAFHRAGAKRMIVSLNKVDDDLTQTFMINFYHSLASGKSIYDSFWEAMNNADEETRNSFILIE